MKIVNYRLHQPFATDRVGIIVENKVIDMASASQQQLPVSPSDFFAMGQPAIEKAKEIATNNQHLQASYAFDRSQVTLGPPVPDPKKIICVGTNYADHVAEMGSELPQYPVLFSKFSNALIGPEDAIHKSTATGQLDYEVELALVIGKKASSVKKEQATSYIAGYTIGNDISARDLQKRTPQWLQGKSLDHTTPIGPWVVTADEVKQPGQLDIRSYVNGEERQSSNTRHFIFDIPSLISFISDLITLEPGDIILTGTPDGVGLAMDPPQFLQTGDKVRLEIEQIGEMEHHIVTKP
ncbi:2-hydroxyhepta-2,4-diene-1,7-dioate isomerase [Gracilibacillus halophilus YIM-C55.5]|uniref:2-hydroxyhepta-2,4-diene-1,7-dioate isomerase n=1 Tax=Gracilibacillus halophilus YIM-C55.5 TaxID=1308866 RepID=N4WPE6_9BACI|nr:fumarylacetoacetate hydrolase family protein [Gracilibacillus halophilus]ENH96355.1 2-hydroxyhepta-2,4-diene-1,7-dioate isomerase [Gracilibacillus halophilus YIM-C55.5]